MEGSPESTSAPKRMALANGPRRSMRKRETKRPNGMAMRRASPLMMRLPTMALEMPPPEIPSGVGVWVKKATDKRRHAPLGHVADEPEEGYQREDRAGPEEDADAQGDRTPPLERLPGRRLDQHPPLGRAAGSLPDGDGAGASSRSVLTGAQRARAHGSLNCRFLRTMRRPPMLTASVMTRSITARARSELRSNVPGC